MLAAALGMTVDPSSEAPTVPAIEEPTAVPVLRAEEKKSKGMARLDRIKAKAIKSANRDLGVDAGKLASAMGVVHADSSRSKPGYGVWVSEIMLQQTRVEAVIPFWVKCKYLYKYTSGKNYQDGPLLRLAIIISHLFLLLFIF